MISFCIVSGRLSLKCKELIEARVVSFTKKQTGFAVHFYRHPAFYLNSQLKPLDFSGVQDQYFVFCNKISIFCFTGILNI